MKTLFRRRSVRCPVVPRGYRIALAVALPLALAGCGKAVTAVSLDQDGGVPLTGKDGGRPVVRKDAGEDARHRDASRPPKDGQAPMTDAEGGCGTGEILVRRRVHRSELRRQQLRQVRQPVRRRPHVYGGRVRVSA